MLFGNVKVNKNSDFRRPVVKNNKCVDPKTGAPTTWWRNGNTCNQTCPSNYQSISRKTGRCRCGPKHVCNKNSECVYIRGEGNVCRDYDDNEKIKSLSNTAINNMNKILLKGSEVFNLLEKKSFEQNHRLLNQKYILDTQNKFLEIRNREKDDYINKVKDIENKIQTGKRKLMYDSVENRSNIIMVRVLKFILLLLSIIVITMLAIK